jgi:hypothetical protein
MDALKIKEINKRIIKGQISKKELFELEQSIKKELENIVSEKLEKLGSKVRHTLYECRYCADAKFKYKYEDGEEKELFVSDCAREECPYAEYFKDQNKANEIDLLLKKMLEE